MNKDDWIKAACVELMRLDVVANKEDALSWANELWASYGDDCSPVEAVREDLSFGC